MTSDYFLPKRQLGMTVRAALVSTDFSPAVNVLMYTVPPCWLYTCVP